jgi:hypothetical protein
MRKMRVAAALLAAAFLAVASMPRDAAANFNDLPEIVRDELFYLTRICNSIGGRPGNPMTAIEEIDLDGDAILDIILDAARFTCAGVAPAAHCPDVGCSTSVFLSHRGNWRPAFDIVGSYCIDRTTTPATFVTIQRNFIADRSMTILNVRYRFSKGMAFQEGRGSC